MMKFIPCVSQNQGPGAVTGADIICPEGVEVISKDLHICTLEEGGMLEMELQARIGRGYVSADTNKQLYQTPNQPLGIIYTDSIYTPIEKVSYNVEPTRVGQDAHYDKVALEIWTDSSLSPAEAVALASKISDRPSGAADECSRSSKRYGIRDEGSTG